MGTEALHPNAIRLAGVYSTSKSCKLRNVASSMRPLITTNREHCLIVHRAEG